MSARKKVNWLPWRGGWVRLVEPSEGYVIVRRKGAEPFVVTWRELAAEEAKYQAAQEQESRNEA